MPVFDKNIKRFGGGRKVESMNLHPVRILCAGEPRPAVPRQVQLSGKRDPKGAWGW
jgi:hypothetical protein